MKSPQNKAIVGGNRSEIPSQNGPSSFSPPAITAEAQAPADTIHLVCFLLGDEELAVPVDRVIEVVKGDGLSPITDSSRYLAGMLPYRTETIPVIRLKQWLDIASAQTDAVHRVVIVSQGEKLIGLAVDEITQVLRGNRRFWQTPSDHDPRQRFVAGYYTDDERRIPILECNHLPGL